MLTEQGLILCDLCRGLQVLHLQSRMGALGGASSRKVLRCLEQSAALRVLSLTRGMQVRRDTLQDSALALV